jgi:hypothetical protein
VGVKRRWAVDLQAVVGEESLSHRSNLPPLDPLNRGWERSRNSQPWR